MVGSPRSALAVTKTLSPAAISWGCFYCNPPLKSMPVTAQPEQELRWPLPVGAGLDSSLAA